MNSLNILTTIGTNPPATPAPPRRSSESDSFDKRQQKQLSDANGNDERSSVNDKSEMVEKLDEKDMLANRDNDPQEYVDEKLPLLRQPAQTQPASSRRSSVWMIPKRLSEVMIGAVKAVFSAVILPGRYLVACFYGDEGGFSVFLPLYNMSKAFTRQKTGTHIIPSSESEGSDQDAFDRKGSRKRSTKRSSISSSSSVIGSDSEYDHERNNGADNDTPARNTRSRTSVTASGDDISPAKRSIRIKLHNEEALRQRKQRKNQADKASRNDRSAENTVTEEAAAALKSPMVSATSSKLTKFPRTPQPPRPLIPRRQPSYSMSGSTFGSSQRKTLILDLDETLIHSMSKGGRFTTGHMVEVKLQQPVGIGGTVLGPQVPILYYVHKRPYCDEFLKKVCKWYNLIIFTASVQEYADPVIDWLELERKYFVGRYYRQHCTLRNNAYIKDLSQVEPDLSKVMIIDNSPMSYIFHEDNAIPIEGWISDPTDNDLLHLIPLLEGLQYVTDVRALLALRLGEPVST